jgi:hypothetical protein
MASRLIQRSLVHFGRSSCGSGAHAASRWTTAPKVTGVLINDEIQTQLGVWKQEVGDNFFEARKYKEAATNLSDLVMARDLPDFLTTPCYLRFMAD